MDPEAGKWIMQCCGENAGLTRNAGIMKLTDVMTRLGLELQHSDLMRQNHDAAADAQMTRLSYIAMLERVDGKPIQKASPNATEGPAVGSGDA